MDDNYASFGPDELMNISAPLLQTVLDTIPMGVYVLKAIYKNKRIIDFEYILVNEEARKYSTEADLEGRSFLHVNNDQDMFKRLVRVTQTGSAELYSYRLHIGSRQCLFNVKCVKFNNGVMLTYQDVTQQLAATERIKQNDQKWQAVVENTPDPIARLDKSHRFVFVNKAFLTATRRQLKELIGKTTQEIGTPIDIADPWTKLVTKVLTTGEPGEIAIYYSR
jgi:PAS domain-containing protein